MPKPSQAINLPPRVQSGQAITAAQFNQIRESLARLARAGIADGPRIYPRRVRQALWPVLGLAEDSTPEAPSYVVTVTPGYVVERIVKSGTDAIVYHLPEGIFEEDGETLAALAITDGQCVAVKVNVKPDGTVGAPAGDPPPAAVELVIIASTEESEHHKPPIGEGSGGAGEAGFYYYKLAKLEDGELTFAPGIPGHDIEHWIDLPTFESAGGETIWKEWDSADGKYMTKGLEGVDGITVTPTTDTLEIGFTGGDDLNLEVYLWQVDNDGVVINFPSSPESIQYWRGGIYVGNADPDGGSPPAGLITQQVARLINVT